MKDIELATSILEGRGYTVTKDHLYDVEAANARLLVERADADKHIASLQDHVSRVAAERGVLRMANDEAADRLARQMAKLNDRDETIARLQEDLYYKGLSVDGLSLTVDSYTTWAARVKETWRELKDVIDRRLFCLEWLTRRAIDSHDAALEASPKAPTSKESAESLGAERDDLRRQLDLANATIRKCLDDHITLAGECGNTRGAMQLRAVANLLGAILRGETPGTVCPEVADPRDEAVEFLESQNDAMAKEIDELRLRNKNQCDTIVEQDAELVRRGDKITSLRDEIADMSVELAEYQEADDVGSEKIRETEEDLQATIESQSKLIADLRKKNGQLGAKLHEARKELNLLAWVAGTGRRVINVLKPTTLAEEIVVNSHRAALSALETR